MIDRAMNPYANEDFQNAVKDASENLKKMGEKMKDGILLKADDLPYISFDDLEPQYCGTMRLKESDMWESITDYLTDSGYEVTVRKEDDNKFVVIEYREVE